MYSDSGILFIGEVEMETKKPEKSYEKAIEQLENIVKQLEKNELSLDELVNLFQKGIKLSGFCSKRLDEVERKISILMEDEDGNLKEKSFEAGEKNEL